MKQSNKTSFPVEGSGITRLTNVQLNALKLSGDHTVVSAARIKKER